MYYAGFWGLGFRFSSSRLRGLGLSVNLMSVVENQMGRSMAAEVEAVLVYSEFYKQGSPKKALIPIILIMGSPQEGNPSFWETTIEALKNTLWDLWNDTWSFTHRFLCGFRV